MEYSGSGQSTRYASVGYDREVSAPRDTPPESSRIRDGVTASEQSLSDIHTAIDMLTKRLDTVLRPVPPSAQSTASQKLPQSVSSHLAGRVEILNEGFRAAIDRLHELHSRVEV